MNNEKASFATHSFRRPSRNERGAALATSLIILSLLATISMTVLAVVTHESRIAGSDLQAQVKAQTPLGRTGQPQDIAGAVVFLASADSAWITGETLVISGGYR